MKLLVILAISLSVASGYEKCPAAAGPPVNFQMEDFLGTWYELRSMGNWWETSFKKCFSQDYHLDGDDYSYQRTTVDRLFKYKSVQNTKIEWTSDLKMTYSWKSGLISYTDGPYSILETDYKNYALVLKCENHWYRSFTITAYVLGRDRSTSISQEVKNKMNEALKPYNTEINEMYTDLQSSC